MHRPSPTKPRSIRKTPKSEDVFLHHQKGCSASDVSAVSRFFKSMRWDELWNEFLMSRLPNGRLRYVTSWQFARTHGKNKLEKELIYEAIGPKEVSYEAATEEGKKSKRRIPYLGNWQQIRAKAYFYDKESIDKMRVVIADKQNQMEASRAAATMWLDMLAKYIKFDDDIDEAYDHSPVANGLAPSQQVKRTRFYYEMKRENFGFVEKLFKMYMVCMGIQVDDVSSFNNLVGAVAQGAAQGAAAGANQTQLPTMSPALLLLSNAMLEKSRIFNMPLPSVLNLGESEGEERA